MPANIERVGDLEISQDLQFQEREWKAETVAWIIMALILIAALLGLLGPGPLSRQIAGEPDSGLWIEYNRFVRFHAPETLRVHVRPADGSGSEVRLWLNRDFVNRAELKDIDPQPERVEAWPDRLVYIINLPQPRQAATLIVHFEANEFGPTPVNLGLEDGPELNFNQFYFP
ncbi:MAG: hypothetical protein KJ077_22465 [Anaerolineae bacterium]|nr:hypothetical protein [Anaerolineae bacterium]